MSTAQMVLQEQEDVDLKRQVFFARLSGLLFLWLIVTGLAGIIIPSRISGSGSYADVAGRIAASERMFRFGLCTGLVETLSAILLGFSLYVTLRPVDKLLAQLGMLWRVSEGLIGAVGMVVSFAELGLFTSKTVAASGAEHAQALVSAGHFAGNATYNFSALCFSIGSLIFFCLFFRSGYIPRVLSAFGILASVVVIAICFGDLMFPEYAKRLMYGWAPMAIVEVMTGFWLMFGKGIGKRT